MVQDKDRPEIFENMVGFVAKKKKIADFIAG